MKMLAEILVHKIYIRHFELSSAEIIENSRIGGEVEAELIGIKSLTLRLAEGLVFSLAAILAVTQKGPARVGHLGANLVGASGVESAFHKAETVGAFYKLIVRNSGFGTGLRAVFHINLIFLGVLENIALQPAFGGLGSAVDYAEIALIYLPVADFVVEYAQRFRVFCGNDDAAGVAVNAVAKGRGEAMLLSGSPFALLVGVGLNIGDESVVVPFAGTVAENSGLLSARRMFSSS